MAVVCISDNSSSRLPFRTLSTLLFALVLFGSANGARRSTAVSQPTENCFAKNIYNSLMFKCKRPQPRAFKSSQIVGELYSEGEYIKPCMTVLHRCDSSSGCCMQREGMSCAPKETSVVRLDFKIRPKFSRGERLVTILARNHTACECVDDSLIREEGIGLKAFHFSQSGDREEDDVSQVVVY